MARLGTHRGACQQTDLSTAFQSRAGPAHRLWDALIADGGKESVCGWLSDRFGMSWQITPGRLNELMSDPDPDKARRVMEAMLKMVKIDIAELERAAGEPVPA